MMDRRTALLYSRLWKHKRLVRETGAFIKWALRQCGSPCVSCSFGKDSAVMLHLVLQERPGIPVLFLRYEETALLANYSETISRWGNIRLETIDSGASILDNVNEAKELPRRAKAMGFDACFVGLREEESARRRINLRKYGKLHQCKNGIFRICPLQKWALNDIISYIYANELPTLDTYSEVGFEARTTVGLADDDYGFRAAQLAAIKRTDLRRFNELIRKYPSLRAYV